VDLGNRTTDPALRAKADDQQQQQAARGGALLLDQRKQSTARRRVDDYSRPGGLAADAATKQMLCHEPERVGRVLLELCVGRRGAWAPRCSFQVQ
jgi:hypothetical protein